MESLRELLFNYVSCLGQRKSKVKSDNYEAAVDLDFGSVNEKAIANPDRYEDHSYQPTALDVASHVFSILQGGAESPSQDLKATMNNVSYQTASWKERFAKALLANMIKAIDEGTIILKGAMGEAYEKATRAAEGIPGFVHDHPYWTAAIAIAVALGMLYLLMPFVLEILGFEAEGVLEGAFCPFQLIQMMAVSLTKYRILCCILAVNVWRFRF